MPRPQFLVTLTALSFAVGFMTGCSPTGGPAGPAGDGNTNTNTNTNINTNTNSNTNENENDNGAADPGGIVVPESGPGSLMSQEGDTFEFEGGGEALEADDIIVG